MAELDTRSLANINLAAELDRQVLACWSRLHFLKSRSPATRILKALAACVDTFCRGAYALVEGQKDPTRERQIGTDERHDVSHDLFLSALTALGCLGNELQIAREAGGDAAARFEANAGALVCQFAAALTSCGIPEAEDVPPVAHDLPTAIHPLKAPADGTPATGHPPLQGPHRWPEPAESLPSPRPEKEAEEDDDFEFCETLLPEERQQFGLDGKPASGLPNQ
jgi:hypothetical protein